MSEPSGSTGTPTGIPIPRRTTEGFPTRPPERNVRVNGGANGHAQEPIEVENLANGHSVARATPENGSVANGHTVVLSNEPGETNGTHEGAIVEAPAADRVLTPSEARAERVAARAVRLAAWREGREKARQAALAPVLSEAATGRPPAPRMKKRWSALLCIGIPVIAATVYFNKYATDQYIAIADFSVVSPQSGAKPSALGSLGGAASEGPMAEQFIVLQYVGSLQMIADIKPYLDIRKIYSNPQADWWSRLKKPDNGEVTDEALLAYWNSMVSVNFDMVTGLTEIQVRAFTPADAKTVAERVLSLSEDLVNRLSERSREDSLRLSRNEVDLALKRANKARDALKVFSQQYKEVSPDSGVKIAVGIQTTLEGDLATAQSQLEILRKSLPEDAPGVLQLKNNIAVMQSQLAAQKAHATEGTSGSAAELASAYGKLQLESEFATQAYMSALTALEGAQLQAISQSAYIETFIHPQLPTAAGYPNRLADIVLTGLISAVVWLIGSFVIAAIREH